LARESAKEIVLKDPIRDEIVLAVADIDEKRVGGSLMPDGLDQSLTDAELADLFRFLSELGKPGQFVVTHRALARRWQMLAPVPQGLIALDAAALGKLLHEDSALAWTPKYARVSGDVPLADVGQVAVLRCQVDVITPGAFTFLLNDAQGLTLWIDGKAVAGSAKVTTELTRGQHTFTFRIDPGTSKERQLRFELSETANSKGQAKFVDGR
jgi:hypothetical protein